MVLKRFEKIVLRPQFMIIHVNFNAHSYKRMEKKHVLKPPIRDSCRKWSLSSRKSMMPEKVTSEVLMRMQKFNDKLIGHLTFSVSTVAIIYGVCYHELLCMMIHYINAEIRPSTIINDYVYIYII